MTFWQRVSAYVIYYAVTAYCMTWRYKFKNRGAFDNLINEGKKPVVAIWHEQLLPCAFINRNKGIVTIASDSKDGELIAFALNKWGFRTARGSSTRGGVKAAIKAIKTSRKYGVPCAVTVDGPKGPRHKVKSGAVFIATNLDEVAIAGIAKAKRSIRFNSWDKFSIPLPFSAVEIIYSDPIRISCSADKEAMEKERQKLERIMMELTDAVYPASI